MRIRPFSGAGLRRFSSHYAGSQRYRHARSLPPSDQRILFGGVDAFSRAFPSVLQPADLYIVLRSYPDSPILVRRGRRSPQWITWPVCLVFRSQPAEKHTWLGTSLSPKVSLSSHRRPHHLHLECRKFLFPLLYAGYLSQGSHSAGDPCFCSELAALCR